MRISGNFCQPQNTLFNANRVNSSIAKQNPEQGKVRNGQKQDKADISPQGKMMNAIENLTKQKDAINERKSKLIAKTMESGANMKTIEAQLDTYAEQIKTIDKQISDIYNQQAKDAMEKSEKDKPKKTGENKTEEQIKAEHMNTIAGASEQMKQSQSIADTARKVEGEARVKETEVNMGELHIDILESKAITGDVSVEYMIANERQALNAKEDIIAELVSKAEDLVVSQGSSIGDIREEINVSNEEVAEAANKQEPKAEIPSEELADPEKVADPKKIAATENEEMIEE